MGGSSSKQVVGYYYYAGMHMVLCHGPVDLLRRVEVDRKLVFSGFSPGGRLDISLPGLFGGESREGGIVGAVDIEMGDSDQGQNDYLQGQLTTDIPAFRGVLGVVLRQLYLGVNPYLKPWSFRAQRVFTAQGGEEQWESELAPIVIMDGPVAIYMALDFSSSMTTNDRFINLQITVNEVLDVLGEASAFIGTPSIDIMMVGFGGSDYSRESILRRDVDATDIIALKAWITAATNDASATYFPAGFIDSESFYDGAPSDAGRFSFMITDGEPNPGDPATVAQAAADLLFANDDVTAFGFNIDLTDTTYTAYLDNTPEDGVPVLSGSNLSQFRNTVLNAIAGQVDMNPSHIIRESLTNSDWGLGYPESDMEDVSFEAAANTLIDEQMGMSLLWDRQIPLSDFVNEILRHIDGAVYVSRTTGEFVLKLIRADYTVGSLTTLDPSNTKKLTSFVRPVIGELVNSLTINYWDYKTGNESSLSIQDPALVQMQGAVINTTVTYPGFTNTAVASRAATRDLKTLSTPLISCTIETNQVARDFNIGDVFILDWPDYEVDNIVMRVLSISFGDGVYNNIKIKCTQDKFDSSSAGVVVRSTDEWVEPGGPPIAVDYQLTEEATYWELIQAVTQVTVDDELDASPDTGYISVAAVRPLNGLSARVWVDSGPGYVDSSPLQFCPFATLLTAADYLDTTFYLDTTVGLLQVVVGTFAQIGNELFTVEAVDTTLNTVTVGRGILDTYPEEHAIGATIFFSDRYTETDGIQYVAPEEIAVKVATTSSSGDLDIASATEYTVIMDSRAYRPYPPGRVRIDGDYYPESVIGLNDIEVTWTHRDRTQQTAGFLDFTDGSVGPETGVTYTLECYNENDILSTTYTGLTGTSQEWDTEVADSGLGRYNSNIRIVLYSVRDGYDSYQVFDWSFNRLSTPVNTVPPIVTVISAI